MTHLLLTLDYNKQQFIATMTMKINEEYKIQTAFRSKLAVLKHLLLDQEESSYILDHYADKDALSNEQLQDIQSLVNRNKDELTRLLIKNINDFISGKYLKEVKNPELIKYSFEYQRNNFINKIADYIKQYGLKIPLHFEDDASLFGENIARITFIETLIALEFEGLIAIISLREGMSKPHEDTSGRADFWSLQTGYSKNSFTAFPVPIANIQLTKKLIGLIEPHLSYQAHKIHFKGKEIFIADGFQDSLCRVLMKNIKMMKKEWSWDEVLDERKGKEDYGANGWRKVYGAGREVNKKVAMETGIKDLLIVRKNTIFVNPKYLPYPEK